jgi:hypothetical protein
LPFFVGNGNDPEHWVKIGRSFQRFALQATTLDIRTAHINQPVDVPAVRTQFADWLGMSGRRPDPWQPVRAKTGPAHVTTPSARSGDRPDLN